MTGSDAPDRGVGNDGGSQPAADRHPLKQRHALKVRAIGLAFYERDDYPRVLEVMADAHRLPATYDAFLRLFEQGERELLGKDAVVVRAVIKPDQFAAWCLDRHLSVASEARIRFANEVAAAEMRRRIA